MFGETFPGQLRLAHKFLILSVIALLLVSIPTYFYVREAARSLDAYETEQQGLPQMAEVMQTVQLTQQHRGLAALVLGGVAAAEDKRRAKQAEADQAYVRIDALVKAMADPAVDRIWQQARRDWETLRAGVANKSLSVPQSFAAHGALVPQLLKLNDRVGDHFGLSLDPDRDSYQLIQSMYYQLPYLTEELGRTRALGAGLLAKKAATPEERIALSSTLGRVTDRLDQTRTASPATIDAPIHLDYSWRRSKRLSGT